MSHPKPGSHLTHIPYNVGLQVNTLPGARTYVYLWLIHVDVWQKPTKFCKAIILQLKNKIFKKEVKKKKHFPNTFLAVPLPLLGSQALPVAPSPHLPSVLLVCLV